MKFKPFLKTKILIAFIFVAFASIAVHAERPIVSAIKTNFISNNEVSISWTLPEEPDIPVLSLLLYRDTQPITTYKILEHIVPLASFSATITTYVDTLPDFLSYYYAVLAVTKNGAYEILLPSINSTVIGMQRAADIFAAEPVAEPVAVEKVYPAGIAREAPLPSIWSDEYPSGKKISNNTKSQAMTLLGNEYPNKKEGLSPFVFEQDFFSPEGGDDYILFNTLRRTFAQRDYPEAIVQLETLTGTNLEKDVVVRGTFYLGQSYYFTGDYVNAVRCFLSTSGKYPELSKKWIDYALDLIN